MTGDLTNNGTFTATDGALDTSGSANQLVGGNSRCTLQSPRIGAAGATLGTAISLRGALTLLGDLTTIGLLVNSGGIVTALVTVQRAIAPSRNAGLGYRHCSAPVSATTVADLPATASSP